MILSTEITESVLKVIVYCTLVGFLIYIPRLIYYIEGFKKPVHLKNPKKNKLAVLVPARNEKGVVHLLDSLASQTYDSKYFDTYVIVADPLDPTVQLCSNYKNTECVIVEKQTCKGDALNGAITKILKSSKKYAGYMIVDADNVLDENFVLEMNNSLVTNADVILGKRCIKNYLYGKEMRNWVVNCNGLIYTFLDKLGNAFRSKHGMHSSICGTGIMISGKLIEEFGGWPFRSITEDFELAISSLVKDRTIYLYEPAITYTEESLSHKSANDRRKRWLLGYAQVTTKYRKLVVEKYHEDQARLNENLSADERKKVLGNFWGCFDFLYSFIPLAVIFAPVGIGAALFLVCTVSSIFKFGFLAATTVFFAKRAAVLLLFIYGILFAYTLIGMLADRKYLKISFFEKLAVLFINPFYISEYVGFFFWSFYMMAKGTEDAEWVSIDRIEDSTPVELKVRK